MERHLLYSQTQPATSAKRHVTRGPRFAVVERCTPPKPARRIFRTRMVAEMWAGFLNADAGRAIFTVEDRPDGKRAARKGVPHV